MRRIGDSESDKQALELLKAGAEAAQDKSTLEKRLKQAEEQISLLRYALMNVMKTLKSYPLISSQVEELDYRTLGIMKAIDSGLLMSPTGPVTISNFGQVVEDKARDARQEAFDELSNDDDERQKLEDDKDAALTDAHTVIYETSCKDSPLAGIFRSKIPLAAAEFKDQKDTFLGKKVGDTFEVKIQGKDHLATIHGIRKKKDASTEQ